VARNVRRASAVLFFSGLTLAAVSQQAAAAAQAAPDRAQQLFRLSGMDRQLGSLAATIELQIANEAGIPDSMRPTLARAARDAYAPESLRGVALSHLRPKLATGPLDAVMKWLSSERGRRITQLEETASTLEAQAKLATFAATLQASPPRPERVALIQRLDAATRSTDLATDVALRIAAAVARGLLAAQPISTPTPDLDAILEAQRPQMRAGMQSSVLVTYLFTYRELSDADLGAYVAFMESGPGQWYNDATSSAFVASLDYAASRLSANLAMAGRPQAPANAR
jgi:hypothetical protein